jgi:hypothetical protein
MPRLRTLLFLLLAALTGACGSTAPPPRTAEVLYVGRPDDGTLTLRSVGYGEDTGRAVQHAEESAFKALLFRGIPGSPQANAMAGAPARAAGRHEAYFDELFAGGRYATFMTESYLEGEPEQGGGLRRAVVTLTINENALRRDLEEHGVIRRFGL